MKLLIGILLLIAVPTFAGTSFVVTNETSFAYQLLDGNGALSVDAVVQPFSSLPVALPDGDYMSEADSVSCPTCTDYGPTITFTMGDLGTTNVTLHLLSSGQYSLEYPGPVNYAVYYFAGIGTSLPICAWLIWRYIVGKLAEHA